MANINDRINGQEYESASPLAHAVRYDRAQVKTEEQKKQARENIGCYCEAGGGSGSGSGSSGGGAFVVDTSFSDDIYTMDKTAKEIWEAAQSSTILVKMHGDTEEHVDVMSDVVKRIDTSEYRFAVGDIRFVADGDDVYPLFSEKD